MQRVIVVLTARFTGPKRSMYEARFRWWNNSEHKLVVTNSANMTYESESAFSRIRFVHVPGIDRHGMSRGEAASLLYLQRVADLENASWLVKVTAKYIVPDLTAHLENASCELCVQSSGRAGARSSELFAFRPHAGVFASLRRRNFSRCEHACWKCANCVENWLRALTLRRVTCYFPVIPIDPSWRIPRSHGGALEHL